MVWLLALGVGSYASFGVILGRLGARIGRRVICLGGTGKFPESATRYCNLTIFGAGQ